MCVSLVTICLRSVSTETCQSLELLLCLRVGCSNKFTPCKSRKKRHCEHDDTLSSPSFISFLLYIEAASFNSQRDVTWTKNWIILSLNYSNPKLNTAKVLPGWMKLILAPVESHCVLKPKFGLLLGLRERLILMSLWPTWKTHTNKQEVTPWDSVFSASCWKLDSGQLHGETLMVQLIMQRAALSTLQPSNRKKYRVQGLIVTCRFKATPSFSFCCALCWAT